MDSILGQLYKGELYPYSTFKPSVDGLKEDMDKAFDSYSAFLAKLPDDELKDEFIKFVDQHLDLLPLELEQNFIDGFRIGARMIAEVYSVTLSDQNL